MENRKHKFRKYYKALRRNLSPARRGQAMQDLCQTFSTSYGLVCSYASFGSELNTILLNNVLLKRKCLVLPKINGKNLDLYLIRDFDQDTEMSALGFLEPKIGCTKVLKKDLSLILVPGLAFDNQRHRLGYGKGFYDRFLVDVSEATRISGIGFRESLLKENLPTHNADIPLRELALF